MKQTRGKSLDRKMRGYGWYTFATYTYILRFNKASPFWRFIGTTMRVMERKRHVPKHLDKTMIPV